MAHPVAKLTQPRSFGAYTGKRYGAFFKIGGEEAVTELILSGRAVLEFDAYLVATTALELTGSARFGGRGTSQNVSPKS